MPLIIGGALGLVAIPMLWPLGSGALVLSIAGGALVMYGFIAAGLPIAGLVFGAGLAFGPILFVLWFVENSIF